MNGEGCYDPPSLRKQDGVLPRTVRAPTGYKSVTSRVSLPDFSISTWEREFARPTSTAAGAGHDFDCQLGITRRKGGKARCGNRPHFARYRTRLERGRTSRTNERLPSPLHRLVRRGTRSRSLHLSHGPPEIENFNHTHRNVPLGALRTPMHNVK